MTSNHARVDFAALAYGHAPKAAGILVYERAGSKVMICSTGKLNPARQRSSEGHLQNLTPERSEFCNESPAWSYCTGSKKRCTPKDGRTLRLKC